MESLSLNWFFENRPDFEYKKYLLLAYLQHVQKQFNQTKLYPALAELVAHYRNLTNFKKSKEAFYDQVPEEVRYIDLKHFKIEFDKAINNDELMKHLEEVINFSLPAMQKSVDEGKEIYDFIEQEISLTPVGILPIYRNEGYLLIRHKEIRVYEYSIHLFAHDEHNYRAVRTQFLTAYENNFVNTSEYIKTDMIRKHKKLPNPATFCVETRFTYPLDATILPITQRLLMKFVA